MQAGNGDLTAQYKLGLTKLGGGSFTIFPNSWFPPLTLRSTGFSVLLFREIPMKVTVAPPFRAACSISTRYSAARELNGASPLMSSSSVTGLQQIWSRLSMRRMLGCRATASIMAPFSILLTDVPLLSVVSHMTCGGNLG